MPPEPTEKELEKLKTLLERWNHDWNYARPYFDDGKKDYLAYKFFRDPNSHPYKYNPSVPLVFTIIENMKSTIFNSFFQKDTIADIQPMEGSHMTAPEVIDEVMCRQLTKVVNALTMHPDREFVPNMQDFIENTCTFGNGYTTTLPDFDFNQTSDGGGPLYLGPKVCPVSFWKFVPDREAYRISNSRWCWYLEWVSFDDLKERHEHNGYKDPEGLKKDDWIPEDFHRDVMSKLGKGANPTDAYDQKNDMYLLLHNYDMKTGHYVTMAGCKMIIRDSTEPITVNTPTGPEKIEIPPYPYCPFDDLRLWPFHEEFFAMGVGAVARGFQEEINLWKSMRFENVELGIHKFFLLNELMGPDPDDLWIYPGSIIPLKDVEKGLKVGEVGDITQGSYIEQAQTEKDAQDATSMHETMRGNETNRRETATTIVTLQRAGLKRLETFMKIMATQWFRSILLKIIIQIRTYMTQSEYERIIGEPDAGFYMLRLSDIKRGLDIRPSSSSIDQIREIEQQNVVNFLQIAAGQEDLFNRPELARFIFSLFFPNQNPDRFVMSQEQIMQAQQQQMLAQQGGQPGAEQALNGGTPAGGQPIGQPTIDAQQIISRALEGRMGGRQGQYQ